MCNSISDFTESDIINYFANYIERSQRIRVITAYPRIPRKLSSTSMRLIQSIGNRFSTISVDMRELVEAPSSDSRLQSVRQWLKFHFQRKSLSLLFIDNEYEDNVNRALMDRISLIANFTVWDTRPHCLLFVVNSARAIDLREFFDFTWRHKFLDIVLIEIAKSATSRNLFLPSADRFSILMHQFNPFDKTYHVKSFLDKTHKMFIKKLNNMHGHTLRTGIFDDIPLVMIERNYTGDDVWGLAQGMDVMITRTLAETMNFTAQLNIINTENPNIKRFNVSKEYMESALENESIDFVVNFCGMIISKPLEDMIFESSIFLYTFSSNLIIKQYSKSVTKLSLNLMIVTLVIGSTLVAFSVVIRLLRLDTKIWTTFNVAKVMVGLSISAELRKVYERIIFLTLALISAALSVNILEQLLDVYLWREAFLDLHTLQDVLDAGIVPTITESTKRMISSNNHSALQRVLETSILIEEERVSWCIDTLINHNNISGCEVDSILGRLLSRSFADKERGWIITLVNEPLVQPCWTAMLLMKTSPYVIRFNYILRIFLESGLISHWYQNSLKNFSRMHKDFFGTEQLSHDNSELFHKSHFLKSNKVSLNKKIVLILIIGYTASCLAFVLELTIGHCSRGLTAFAAKAHHCLH